MLNSLSVEITNLVRKQFKYYFIVYKYLIHENTRKYIHELILHDTYTKNINFLLIHKNTYMRGYNTYTRIHEYTKSDTTRKL